jgi:hypothetical protein
MSAWAIDVADGLRIITRLVGWSVERGCPVPDGQGDGNRHSGRIWCAANGARRGRSGTRVGHGGVPDRADVQQVNPPTPLGADLRCDQRGNRMNSSYIANWPRPTSIRECFVIVKSCNNILSFFVNYDLLLSQHNTIQSFVPLDFPDPDRSYPWPISHSTMSCDSSQCGP